MSVTSLLGPPRVHVGFFGYHVHVGYRVHMHAVTDAMHVVTVAALSLDKYDAEGEGGWVLLEPVAGKAVEE